MWSETATSDVHSFFVALRHRPVPRPGPAAQLQAPLRSYSPSAEPRPARRHGLHHPEDQLHGPLLQPDPGNSRLGLGTPALGVFSLPGGLSHAAVQAEAVLSGAVAEAGSPARREGVRPAESLEWLSGIPRSAIGSCPHGGRNGCRLGPVRRSKAGPTPDFSKDLPVRFLENTDSQDTCGADSGDGA